MEGRITTDKSDFNPRNKFWFGIPLFLTHQWLWIPHLLLLCIPDFRSECTRDMCFLWLLIGSVCCRLRLQVSQLLLKLESAWILYRVISSWEKLCGDIVQTVPLCLSGKIRYLAYTSVHAPAMHVREAMIFESLGLTPSM